MKNLLIILSFVLVTNCTNTKSTYWCGDHPCINAKEREAYFKKTMIVEIRDLKKETKKSDSNLEKIMKEAIIYDAVRTPRGKGKKSGSLNEVSPVQLASKVLKAIEKRSNIDTSDVDDVVLGLVEIKIALYMIEKYFYG